MLKRTLSLVLAVCMGVAIFSAFPSQVSADETAELKDENVTRPEIVTNVDENGNVTEEKNEGAKLVDTNNYRYSTKAYSENTKIVNFNTKGNATTKYTEYSTGKGGYTNGRYGADAAYLGTVDNKVKFMLSGVVGLVDKSEVQVIDISLAKEISVYEVNSGSLIHRIVTDMTTPGYASSINNGPAPAYLKNGIKYYSYDGHYFYTNYTTMLNDYQSNHRNNSVNKTKPFYNYFQYLPLRSQTSYNSSALNKAINSKAGTSSKMYNTAETFNKAQNIYGVNTILAVGIAANESAWGKSSIAQNKNNLFGLNAFDVSPGESANSYKSIEDCIYDFSGAYMSKGYLYPNDWRYCGGFLGDKASGINVQYASDPYWGEKAAGMAYSIDNSLQKTDYSKYQIGIKDTLPTQHTPLNIRQFSNTNCAIPYKTGSSSNYAVLILGDENGFYKIQSDGVLNSERSSLVSGKKEYDFNKMYAYISDDYVVEVNDRLGGGVINPKIKSTTDNSITISWNHVQDVQGYALYRLEKGEYVKVTAEKNSITEYTDNNLLPNNEYVYKIMTYKQVNGNYIYSTPEFVYAVTNEREENKLNLRVNQKSGTTITLGWDQINDVDGYVIYKKTNDEYNKIGSVTKNVNFFKDLNLDPETKYSYKVMTYKYLNGTYVYDNDEYIEAETSVLNLSKVKNVRVYNKTLSSIWIGWNSVEDADGYYIYRASATNPQKFEKIATTSGCAYADYKIDNNQTYHYYVEAYKSINGEIKIGEKSEIYKYKVDLMPKIVKNTRIYKVTAGSQWIGWDSAENASGYVVYRAKSGKGYEKIATVTGGKCAYADYDIENKTEYLYYVRAYNNVNGKYYYGSISNICKYKTNFTPGKTQNVRVYKYVDNGYWIAWNSVNKAEGYIVYRREGSSGNFEKIETVNLGKTSFADYDVEKGKSYQYYIRAYGSVKGVYYYGESSNILTVKRT